jgi:regulatory protein
MRRGAATEHPDQAEVEAAAYRAALDSAVKSLALREHGREELERKLLVKGHAPALVSSVLDHLVEHDLQSDARYLAGYVESRIRKGYGPLKIRQELRSRGIREADVEPALTESAEFWIAQTERTLARKFRRPPVDRNDWNARARFLARRGFPADLIYRVLGTFSG